MALGVAEATAWGRFLEVRDRWGTQEANRRDTAGGGVVEAPSKEDVAHE